MMISTRHIVISQEANDSGNARFGRRPKTDIYWHAADRKRAAGCYLEPQRVTAGHQQAVGSPPASPVDRKHHTRRLPLT